MIAKFTKAPSLKKQSLYLLLGKISAFIIKMGMPIILVRLLSQEDYGVYRQFNLVTTTFLSILAIGLGSSLFYFYPTTDAKNRKNYIGQTYILLNFIGLIFLIQYIFFGIKIHDLLGVNSLDSFKVIIPIYVLFMLVSNLSNSIFTAQKKIKYNLFFFPLDILLRTVLIVGFVLFFDRSTAWIHALLFYSLIRTIFMSIYLRKEILFSLSNLNLGLIKKQIKYSLPFAGAILINTIAVRFDKLIINNYITTSEFAIYSLAFLSLPFVQELIQSTQSVLVPDLSKHFDIKQVEKAGNLWKETVTYIASITIPVVIFFWIIAEDLFIVLYTKEYSLAASFFRIYIFVYFLHIFLHGVIFRASNNTLKIFYIDLICFPVTIITGLFLISSYGLYGAVITAIIGKGLPIIIKQLYEKRILQLSFQNWLQWMKLSKIVISSVIPALLIYFVFFNLIESRIALLLISSIVYFLMVFIIEYFLNVFMFEKEVKHFFLLIKRLWTKK
mgnify:FL=1